ncbi:hypothetical protein [Streptomyces sp. NPDC095817]|uniref:hypothetical protein n=1 Tax=Streptomyces sp. NPDC095817 TaxID=3155082 RepID=UPI00332825E8
MRTPSIHHGLRHPLRGKTRLKLILVGVVVIPIAAALPPEQVSAVASAVGATATTVVLLGRTRDDQVLLG